MKIGIICPVRFLQRFATQSDFHLVLPHLYAQYPEYVDFYRERIKLGDFVVQDNSIFELGTSLTGEILYEFALDLGVSEMVAPEVLGNADASLNVLLEFLDFMSQQEHKIPVQAVIQGQSFDELIAQFFRYNLLTEVSTIGLPFDLEYQVPEFSFVRSLTLRRVLSRWKLVDTINNIAVAKGITLKPVHLMGLSDGIELQKYAIKKFPWIRSNDSSSAFVHGLQLIRYSNRGLPVEKIREKLNFGLPEDALYGLTPSKDGYDNEREEAIDFNIMMLKLFAGQQ